MRAELQRLKRDTDSSRSSPIVNAEAAVSSTSAGAHPSQAQAARTSSSAVIYAARQYKLGVGIASAIVLLLIAAGAYGVYALFLRNQHIAFQNFSVNKITDSGKATQVDISPDGKYILHVVNDKGLQSLWLRNVPTNSNTQVMPPEPVQYLGVRFSPDGNYLYFVRGEPGQVLRYLYRAPVLGGAPQKLVTDIDSNVTFSPDGRSLAYFVNNNPELGKFRIVIYSLDSGDGKTLVTGDTKQMILMYPAWSPDGKTIACVSYHQGSAVSSLVAVDAISGQQKLFSEYRDGFLERLAWLPNGRGLLALAWDSESNFTRYRIVEISYPGGMARAVTHDISDYQDLSLSADGRLLATILGEDHFNLFMTPASGNAQIRQLDAGDRVWDFSWTPDGQMLLDQQVMSLLNPETGSRAPLSSILPAGTAWFPSSCANGRYVVFSRVGYRDARTLTVWRMDAGGGNLKQVSDGQNEERPVCSPDGKWVYYFDRLKGLLTRIPLDGGKAEVPSNVHSAAYRYDISPDGKLAVFATLGSVSAPRKQLALIALDSLADTKILDLQHPIPTDAPVRFTHDGKAVVYSVRDQGTDNLWLQPLDGSPGKQLTNFKSEEITDFHWSFDGSKLGMVRGHTDSDVVLLQESKP